jgi:solute:Na+ symporter, SSS family
MNHQFLLTPSDVLVIAGYFILVIWIGLHYRRRMKSAQDYFAGGHQIPWWLAGVSHYMSSFSALSFIAYAQLGYMYGWVAVTLFWVTVPACLLAGAIFARRWRQARIITPVEFLERRFNIAIRQLFAWAGIPMKVFEDGLKIFATSLFLASSMGISVPTAIMVCGVVTIFYTLLGGLWALTVTDYVQFLMKGLAMLLLLPLALWKAGGLHASFAGLPHGFFHPVNGPYTWVYLIGFAVLIAISYNGSWALAQKFYSVKNERDATKAGYLSAALNFIGAPVMILPAIIGRNLLPDLIVQNRTEDAYVLLVLKLLPAGMIGVVIAALLSATMATVSADFSSMASVLTKDVYQRLLKPSASQSHLLKAGRWFTVVIGASSLTCSLWIAFSGHESLLGLMVAVAGVFLAPSYLPILIALITDRLTWKGALTGYITGSLSGFGMLMLRFAEAPHHSAGWLRTFDGVSILVNTCVTGLGLWAGSRLLITRSAERQKIQVFFRELQEPLAEPPAASGPHAEIAKVTVAVGALLGIAGLVSATMEARVADTAVALALVVLGGSMWLRRDRTRDVHRDASPVVSMDS